MTSKAGFSAGKRAVTSARVPVLDRDVGPVGRLGIDGRGRSDDVERHLVVARGERERIRADLVRGVAVRGYPVGAGEARSRPRRQPSATRRARVGDHRERNAERLELPRGQPRALEQRPRLADPDVLDEALAPRRHGSRRARSRTRRSRDRPCCSASGRASPARRASAACAAMRRQRSTSSSWIARARSGVGLVAHLVERPAQVDRRRPSRGELVVCRVEVLAALGRERVPYAAATPIAGAPRIGSVADRRRDLGRRSRAELDLLVGQPPLVEQHDRVRLQPDDPLRRELRARGQPRRLLRALVPRREVLRLLLRQLVDVDAHRRELRAARSRRRSRCGTS